MARVQKVSLMAIINEPI